MPYRITDACAQCALCVDVCPIGAISPGDPIYVIDDTCCDFEECVVECPEDAIVPITDKPESRTETEVGGRVMTHSLVTRMAVHGFLECVGRAYGGSGRVFLLGETSQVMEGWRSWTDAVRFHADVDDRPAWDEGVGRCAERFGIMVHEEFPGDLIPLPGGYASRARPIAGPDVDGSRPDQSGARLSLFHFDPYSVAFRHVARGDEPDYHIVLAYLKHGWIELDQMNRLLTALLPRFSLETIAQDPAEFRRKYKGLLQMAGRLDPGTVHRPF